MKIMDEKTGKGVMVIQESGEPLLLIPILSYINPQTGKPRQYRARK